MVQLHLDNRCVKDKETGLRISSGNSKMPGASFALDSFSCGVGSKLREKQGTVCSSCYSILIQKMRPCVDKSYKKNQSVVETLLSSKSGIKKYIDLKTKMILAIVEKTNIPYFRWFDSGDLVSVDHLLAIIKIAKQTPNVKHWLPTKEYKMVSKVYETIEGKLPKNLTIRVSSPNINQKPLDVSKMPGIKTSTVHTKGNPITKECQAYMQGNKCLDCRACWDKRYKNISYKKH